MLRLQLNTAAKAFAGMTIMMPILHSNFARRNDTIALGVVDYSDGNYL